MKIVEEYFCGRYVLLSSFGRIFIEFFVGCFFIGLFGREGESVGLPAGVLGYADVCVELHYGPDQHH